MMLLFLFLSLTAIANELPIATTPPPAQVDCKKTLVNKLDEFKAKNRKNQETVVNFAQQISDRLRADQVAILQDTQSKLQQKELELKELEKKENKSKPLTTQIVMPLLTVALGPLSKMADETDTVLNAAYDNNKTISDDLEELVNQIHDCLNSKP